MDLDMAAARRERAAAREDRSRADAACQSCSAALRL